MTISALVRVQRRELHGPPPDFDLEILFRHHLVTPQKTFLIDGAVPLTVENLGGFGLDFLLLIRRI